MILLILNGVAQGGKGTVVKNMESMSNLDIFEYSSIDYVKNVATDSFEWDGEKDEKGRNLLADIKQLMINYNDLPFKKVVSMAEEAKESFIDTDILVVDVREPDEIEKLVKHFFCVKGVCVFSCRVSNERLEKEVKEGNLRSEGDKSYDQYAYDYTIPNNGTLQDLRKEVQEFMCHMSKKCTGEFEVDTSSIGSSIRWVKS